MLDNIPFVPIGGGFGFEMGRSFKFEKTSHNRLHLAIAHAVGHPLKHAWEAGVVRRRPLVLG